MSLTFLADLAARLGDHDEPFLVSDGGSLCFRDLSNSIPTAVREVRAGDVVAVIGDFDRVSLATLLHLIDRQAIVVPLTRQTAPDHPYFLDAAGVDVVIENDRAVRRVHTFSHPAYEAIRERGHPGLILFSTGTTGRPKAICHDLSAFLARFATPRPALRTVSFLLFDHIGGVNTFLHTLYNRGTCIVPRARTVEDVLQACRTHAADVLPTTPTFLRMLLLSGLIPDAVPPSLRIITYGTERMDQGTLTALATLLPDIDFRQTYGMSELGILRVKSEARDSLYMRIGGEGVETRVIDDILHIRSATRMLGYLNAPNPFDADGWYDTRDLVDDRNGWYRILGRNDDVVNVGGLKFLTAEVDRVVLAFPGVAFARTTARTNPLTGQHAELVVQADAPQAGDGGGGAVHAIDLGALRAHLAASLPPHMVPRRITLGLVPVNHRFKQR